MPDEGNDGGDGGNRRRRRRRGGGRGRRRNRNQNQGEGQGGGGEEKKKRRNRGGRNRRGGGDANRNQGQGDGGGEGGKSRRRRRRGGRGGRGRGKGQPKENKPQQAGGGEQKKGGGRGKRRRSRTNRRRDRGRRERTRDRDRHPEPIAVEDGVRVAQKGRIGTTWWSRKWVGSLERFGWKNRLERGREYARSGQVLGFHVVPGVVVARVQGTEPKPYETAIKLRPLTNDEWDRVLDSMSASASFAAHLLAGEMPREVEDVFKRANMPLFPQPGSDMETLCSCPDQANPCKHIAALHYVLADALDKDPFILLKLRGREREEVTTALRERRAAAAAITEGWDDEEELEPEETTLSEPLPQDPARFWRYGSDFTELRARPQPVETPHALALRLGAPPGWPESEDYEDLVREGYAAVSRRALAIALGRDPDADEPADEPEDTDEEE